MSNPDVEISPRLKARIAGACYLITFLAAGVALLVSGGLVVSGDAEATAANVLAHEQHFWLGLTCNLIVIASYVAVTALFYGLFKPVSTSLSLLAALFSLVGCAVQASSFGLYTAPMVALGGAGYLNALTAQQLHALALLCLKLYAQTYTMGLAFFGFYCLLIGHLIFRSTFLPRMLGVLMMLGGVSWLTFLSPPLANYLRPYNLAPGALAEATLTLWLLLVGVDARKWAEQAKGKAH